MLFMLRELPGHGASTADGGGWGQDSDLRASSSFSSSLSFDGASDARMVLDGGSGSGSDNVHVAVGGGCGGCAGGSNHLLRVEIWHKRMLEMH